MKILGEISIKNVKFYHIDGWRKLPVDKWRHYMIKSDREERRRGAKMRKKWLFAEKTGGISALAAKILHICLPLTLGALLLLLKDFLFDLENLSGYAVAVYPERFEYVMISLVMIVGGAVVADICEKQNKN